MIIVHDTLILETEDLKETSTSINLFDFNISIAAINTASNIVYINFGEIIFLKVKSTENFKSKNSVLFNNNKK